jgi:hypothetical protein
MFENARMKVEQARRHANDIEIRLASFFEDNKVKCTFREDQRARTIVLDLEPPQPLPDFSMSVADAFRCLRTALDHAAFDIVAPKGVNVAATAFPFATDRVTLVKRNRAYRLIEKVNRKVARLIRDTINPTRAGDQILWFLNEIDKADKHRKLITTVSAVVVLLPAVVDSSGKASRSPATDGLNVNKKISVTIGPIGSRILGLPVFSSQIVLGENGLFEGRPVQKAIVACAERVEQVVTILETAD